MAEPPNGYPSPFARMQHVLELRREGKTYRDIADRTGLKDEYAAQRMVSRAIKRILRETAEEVRSIELSRLEVLIQCLWDQALKDAQGAHPDFSRFDRVQKLLEAKLRWCGATAVEDHSDNHVSITINKFTDAQPTPKVIPPTLQQIEAMTETAEKVEA